MGVDPVVSIIRLMLAQVVLLTAPILVISLIVSLVVSLVQVLTSLQDQTLSIIPRLLATGAALFVLMPWMWRHLATYTAGVFSDFHRLLQ